ncbi:MAG: hypothetical protein ACE5EV_06900 [Gaiellales bacterium]
MPESEGSAALDKTPAKPVFLRDATPQRWEWDIDIDGPAALEPDSHPETIRHAVNRRTTRDDGELARLALKRCSDSASVAHVARPEAYALRPRTSRRRRLHGVHVVRLLGLVAIVGLAIAVAVLAVDRWTGAEESLRPAVSEPSARLLPGGPPEPQVVAVGGDLRLFLPVAADRLTAIGFRGSGETARALDPVGTQANEGLLERVKDGIFGSGKGEGLRYYLIDGGAGPRTGGLDVGAPVGTNVYAPVDGAVLAINDVVINGSLFGHRVDLLPNGEPGLVVVVTNLDVDPSLTVGSAVRASQTRLGRIIDLSEAEEASLAQFTQDRGQHVHLEVQPAGDLALP